MREALSLLISTSFRPPQGLALSLPPVTLTASGNNSMRSMPWGVEMSLRCACQPWRSALPAPLPFFSPRFQAPPPREARTFLGPHPPSQLQSLVPLASLQGSRAILPSTLPFLALPIPLLLPFFNASPFPPCQLALLHTPPLSDIFVFTDASPKDAFLTNRVESLTQERRCRVSMAGGRPHVSCPGTRETL